MASNVVMTRLIARCASAEGDPTPELLRLCLVPFRGAFSAPSWERVVVLVMGALLAPGKRTVTACLRMTGRAQGPGFASYHQILNRARWQSRALALQLLTLLVARLVPEGPVIIGLDDTIERRWGQRSRHAASTAIRCAPAMAISSRRAACDGLASCCSHLCPGQSASRRCLCSPCWPPRRTTFGVGSFPQEWRPWCLPNPAPDPVR